MKKTTISLFCVLLLLFSCATFKEQATENSQEQLLPEIAYTVYLGGGLGNDSQSDKPLGQLEKILGQASANSTLLLLGDNIPKTKDSTGDAGFLKKQAASLKNFKGKTHFIPGDYEWKYADSRKTEHTEKILKELTGENKILLPKNSCPLSSISVNDQLEIIFIDSQWYISDWDDTKYINEKCPDIKTRRRFLEELENLIRDAGFKNIILAMHHPVFSNGRHGGKFSAKDYLSPFPIAGTIDKTVRKLGGSNPQDAAFHRYRELSAAVASLAKLSDNIVIASGHESSLQYLEGGNIHQVISGSLSQKEAVKLSKGSISALGGRLVYKGLYANPENGYAKLLYFKDGSSAVEFRALENDKLLYRHSLGKALYVPQARTVNTALPQHPATSLQQILTDKETDKSGWYKLFWGKHYRGYYSKPVTVQTALLDTLYGGVTILKEGGGHQSQSLRLEDKTGKQYAMRSLKKNALKFLRFKMKGAAFDPGSYENTAAENIVADFFTTAHPYVQLAVGDIAEAAGVNHSNTRLFYFPKQQGFGDLNEKYGDALYFVEERPSKEQKNFYGYGHASESKNAPITDFVGTTEVLEKLRSSEKYSIDEKQYIRSRIFDMLIGDWDRHEDQWRWALHETGSKSGVYAPIPRDRDAAFSKFDGVNLALVKMLLPETRFWQSYDDELKNVKWFNSEAYNLDKIILSQYGEDVWKTEAQSIQQQLSEGIIDKAFTRLPAEVQDQVMAEIRAKLKNRLKNLDKMAEKYAHFIGRKIIVYGSDKKDKIVITREAEGNTKVEIFTPPGAEKPVYSAVMNSDQTCEIWIYGLNGDDDFIVDGKGDAETLVRMIGGYGEDKYTINNTKKARIYDYGYEKLDIDSGKPSKKQLSSLYETNNLHYRFFMPSNNVLLPAIGFATDDGLFLGVKDKFTYNDFNGNPHKQVHNLFANYYFSYQSVEAGYDATVYNFFPKVDFFAEIYFSGSRFSNNFFGYGNETVNDDDDLGMDYNRARTRQTSVKSGLQYHKFRFAGIYETYEIEEVSDRFFTEANLGEAIFKNQSYAGAEASISYKNRDAEDFPTLGLYAEATAGWKTNLEESDNNFGYASAKVGFDQKLNTAGSLVFQSTLAGKVLFGDNFYFYHSSFLGGNNGLRGYRNERFSGKSSLYDSSNLKLRMARFRTGFLPLDFGIYGGFDVGRVWIDNNDSDKWHTSQGGGLWLGGLNMTSLQAGFFNSEEGNILFVGFNFKY